MNAAAEPNVPTFDPNSPSGASGSEVFTNGSHGDEFLGPLLVLMGVSSIVQLGMLILFVGGLIAGVIGLIAKNRSLKVSGFAVAGVTFLVSVVGGLLLFVALRLVLPA